MKDENSQVPETFDEQEQFRPEKRGLRLFFAGWVCVFISFVCILIAVLINDLHLSNSPDGDRIFIIGFFIFSTIGLFLIVKNFFDGLMWESAVKKNKLIRRKLTVLPSISHPSLQYLLLSNQFKNDGNGYYYRKKFSFWQLCFVHYYFRLIPSWNLEETIDQEVDRFDGICRKGRNTASCLILVMYMDNLTADTKKLLKNSSINIIIADTVISPKNDSSFLPVAVNSQTGTGYFFDLRNKRLSWYFHGCRLLKKLTGTSR